MESARAVADRRIKPIDLPLIVAGRRILLIRIFSHRDQTYSQKNQRLKSPRSQNSCCIMSQQFPIRSKDSQTFPAVHATWMRHAGRLLPPASGGLPGRIPIFGGSSAHSARYSPKAFSVFGFSGLQMM